MKVLDDASLRAQADPGDMLGKTASFGPQLFAAMDLPAGLAGAKPGRVLLGGMGGSAVAGRILAPLVELVAGLRILVVDGYSLPRTLPGDLLVLSSYSGRTEEVLSLFEESRDQELRRMAITSGGDLAELAQEAGMPLLSLPEGLPPRAALPSALGRLLGLFTAWGIELGEEHSLPHELEADLDEVLATAGPELPAETNPAKRMALALGDLRPAPVALSPFYSGVAGRLRAQFEENAERSAYSFELPELHHNSWIPWSLDDDPPGVPIWLGAEDAHPRVLERRRLSEAALSDRHIPFFDLPSAGRATLNRLLTSVLIGDFVSVYLALLRGVDPTRTDPLDAMKARLSES